MRQVIFWGGDRWKVRWEQEPTQRPRFRRYRKTN